MFGSRRLVSAVRLAAKARREVWIVGELRMQDLERDGVVRRDVRRAIDRAEPADRDLRVDAVATVDDRPDERIEARDGVPATLAAVGRSIVELGVAG